MKFSKYMQFLKMQDLSAELDPYDSDWTELNEL